ncbi:MAG: hypothetical protein CUN50_02810 [Candidatus Thermofonsia Clade 1 bacterium]|uniref:Uncharacterized protein n=3 Tax=Candidatus Thermofonsia Clade 1 bacterium TaxID=2364210 RepID=A0A2M8PYX5_9CHLR|nr:MAG: hypothetical protein CUN50_02810 [Candidatus Thermofonsia Clade 1 bacterium]
MLRVALLLSLLLLVGCGAPQPAMTPIILFVTATPEPPTLSFSPTPVIAPLLNLTLTPRPTSTPTPVPMPTRAPTLTPSFTATYTDTPEPTFAARACTIAPQGGFAAIYNREPALQQALGCAQSAAVPVNAAIQDFENGRMLWVSALADLPTGTIYAILNTGQYLRYADTWVEGVDPVQPVGIESAPSGRLAPIRGFGKAWALNAAARNSLGWALGAESGTGAQVQRFERGEMIFIAALNQTYVFMAQGSLWRLENAPF